MALPATARAPGGADDADGGEHASRAGVSADRGDGGVQAAVEEDQDECHGADAEGQAEVVEDDAADTLRAADQAHEQEHQHDGDAHAVQGPGEHGARGQQHAEDGEQHGGGPGFGDAHGQHGGLLTGGAGCAVKQKPRLAGGVAVMVIGGIGSGAAKR
jgi:hypothetical protein